ncbi:hypothetical protein T484DRAFT_1821296 [Baffinella frigidus]|nr:hypothetical protein T484DRAFT_1821296 [Cryptophyta sp. CCMP2293]
MPGHRAAILALRPAAIQVGYKNFVASMGADFEPVASPPEFASDYSERLVLLPGSFYATEDYSLSHPECLAHAKELRGGLDVRAEADARRRVVANFNNWKKLDPSTLTVWSEVLRLVPDSVLWLMEMLPYPGPEESLRAMLAAEDVDPQRLLVTQMLPFKTHLLQSAAPPA